MLETKQPGERERLLVEEVKLCAEQNKGCQEKGMYPPHMASSFCESNGRHWDPEKQEFVGYAHCTCSWCF